MLDINFLCVHLHPGDNIEGEDISVSTNSDVAGKRKRPADKDMDDSNFKTPTKKSMNNNNEASCQQPDPSTIEEFGSKRVHLARRARPTNLKESVLASRNVHGLDKVRRRLAFTPKSHKCT